MFRRLEQLMITQQSSEEELTYGAILKHVVTLAREVFSHH
jgi:hypothetical protein